MTHHPYREPTPPEDTERERSGLDLEEGVVHGLLMLVGVIGMGEGLVAARSAALAIGLLLVLFAGQYLWCEGLLAFRRPRKARGSEGRTSSRGTTASGRTPTFVSASHKGSRRADFRDHL